jgi:hypothetical protein
VTVGVSVVVLVGVSVDVLVIVGVSVEVRVNVIVGVSVAVGVIVKVGVMVGPVMHTLAETPQIRSQGVPVTPVKSEGRDPYVFDMLKRLTEQSPELIYP